MSVARMALMISAATLLCGCIPAVRMTVETRDLQGNVIDRADVTNTDTAGRTFHVPDNGTIGLTATAEDSSGLEALGIGGGFTCNRTSGGIGVVQQGTYSAADPNLPGQNPTSESFRQQIPAACAGGTYTATIHACATEAGGGASCTQDATLAPPANLQGAAH